MSLLLLLYGILFIGFTLWLTSAISLEREYTTSNGRHAARKGLVGYTIIVGSFLLFSILILLGTAGLIIFIALLVVGQ